MLLKKAGPLLFRVVVEATVAHPFFRVLVSTEHHVPPCDVAVVVFVATVLVMDAMHFRSLKNVAHPMRRLDIHMVEKFGYRCIECDPCGTFDVQSENRKIDERNDDAVDDQFDRVFVKRRYSLNATGTMVQLMAGQPQEVDVMSQAMPPIEDKGECQIDQKSGDRRRILFT